jgi:hypothetical protein
MANSIAYVLSKNTYPTAQEASNVGVLQGTRIVYTTTSTISNANVLFADSRLTQPIYGDGTNWYGLQLLTDTSVYYSITINNNGSITTDAPPSYTIGQAALGGVVAYINGGGSTGTSGLVATVSDVSAGAAWGGFFVNVPGATGTAIGTGNQNTLDILAADATPGIAAQLCYDLTEGGYSDWYLPSIDELNALYTNRDAIGGFNASPYWSSTKFQTTEFPYTAKFLNFDDAGIGNGSTTGSYRVRAIRSF